MSTVSNVRNGRNGDTTRSIAWLTFFAAFVFGLVAFTVVREARLTTDAGLPVAGIMVVGLAYDRFLAGRAAGRIVGVILTVVAFAAGAMTGVLMPT